MRSDESGGLESPGSTERFAGDLFLRLAVEGWLVVSSSEAEYAISELESTLAEIRSRLHEANVRPVDADVPPEVDSPTVESAFAGRIAADRWERALVELPKYILALRIAGNCW
ncbi:hypothetical protein [Actinophytocola sediminis]